MIPVPEMEAFGERFGFQFVAHAIGNANRSARVERPVLISSKTTFWRGAPSRSWEDLNQQARQWCDKVNSTYKKHIRAVPRELFAVERLHLKPLPAWIPEVYRLHQRTVDVEGYVSLNINPLLGAGRLDRAPRGGARDQGQDRDRTRRAPHRHAPRASPTPSTSASRWPSTGRRAAEGIKRSDPHPEEKAIVAAAPETGRLCGGAEATKAARWSRLPCGNCCACVREYPREPFLAAVREAARYGLYDLDRLERMILRRVTREYFLLGWTDTGR